MRGESTEKCPYCQSEISKRDFNAHKRQHQQSLPVGQRRAHITLPEQQQFAGDLGDEPRKYIHSRCNRITEVPEDVMRTYLADPNFYGAYTFCAGCDDYFHEREFTWVETGENLAVCSEHRRLEFAKKDPSHVPESSLGFYVVFGVGVGAIFGAIFSLKPMLDSPETATEILTRGAILGAIAGPFVTIVLKTLIVRKLRRQQ